MWVGTVVCGLDLLLWWCGGGSGVFLAEREPRLDFRWLIGRGALESVSHVEK